MKRILSVMSLAAALFGAVACEDVMGIIEEFGGDTSKLTEISITPASVTIKAEGGQARIAFEAPSTWSVSSAENWLEFDPAIGTSGEVVVNITARENTGAERRATVTVESGKLKATATVIQEGAGGNTQPGDTTTVNPGTDPEKWYLVGTFNEWDPATSVAMSTRGDGVYTVSINLPEKAEYKFMKDQTWAVNLGGMNPDPIKSGDTISLMPDGFNIIFNPGGDVTITLDVNKKTALLTGGNPDNGGNTQTGTWSVIGTVYGTNWDTDFDMDCGGDFYHYTLYYEDGQEFKFRQNHGWTDPDFGYGPIIMPEPSILDGVQGGANITLPWTGYWDVYLTPATGQIQFYPWINAQWEYFKNPDGSVANVTFTSDCFGTTVTGKVKYYEVNGVRTCKTETGGQGMFGNGNDREWYFVWYTDSDRIKLPIQLCGFTYQGYGEATVISPYYYFGVLNADNNPDIGTYWDFIQNYPSQPECYYDGNGGFYFGVQWYLFMDYGQGFSPQAIDVVGEADGFDRKDYSGSIYVGSAIEGTREIWFNVGRDISAVRYVFIDEKIDDEEKAGAIAAQLAEGSIDFETLTIDMFETDNGRSYYTYINYTAEVPGYHTVIAVGLDAQGEWRFWYYYWFNLDPVEDTSGYTWTSIGTGSYTDDIIASIYDGENLTWDVEIEQCNEDPSRIRMVYPYDGKFEYNAEGEWATDMSYDIEIMIPDEKHVYILPQKTGMDWGYGMISMASFAGYFINNGWAIEEIEQSKGVEFFGTLVDGVITFPVKGCVVYEGENLYYANNNGAFKLVLPGYAAGGSDGEGTVGATGVARRSAKKTGKTVETMTSGNGGGGRAIKPRPVLEIVR